ncbi:MAG: hypothetical protein LC775_09390, partial [Acidobacteria bacterium]|nr:hypothetical protein [Acidobacteriota bacterium]
MGYVQEYKEISCGTRKTFYYTYVGDNNDNFSARCKVIPALFQEGEWVIDVLEDVMEINQTSLCS